MDGIERFLGVCTQGLFGNSCCILSSATFIIWRLFQEPEGKLIFVTIFRYNLDIQEVSDILLVENKIRN